MGFLEWLVGIIIKMLADMGIQMIRNQVQTGYTEAKIDAEVKAVKDAVTAAEKAAEESGSVPPELEKQLREAARRLNSNFID
jgi:hypothetical protein